MGRKTPEGYLLALALMGMGALPYFCQVLMHPNMHVASRPMILMRVEVIPVCSEAPCLIEAMTLRDVC